MTAEIAILNRSAVALAADSAVTVSAGNRSRKVFNTANKIFNLTKHYPVGVMIYNNSSFNSVPLETLIKFYREELNDTGFDTIEQYSNDFIKWLRKNIRYFPERVQINNAQSIANIALNYIYSDMKDSIKDFGKGVYSRLSEVKKKQKRKESVFESVASIGETIDKSGNLSTIKVTDQKIKDAYGNAIKNIIKDFTVHADIELSVSEEGKILSLIFKFITKHVFHEDWSGLVFVGFGRKEIFPSIVELKLGSIILDKIRYEVMQKESISVQSDALISPFAQRDMADTFIQGLDPQLETLLKDIVGDAFETYTKYFVDDVFNIQDASERKKIYETMKKLIRELKDDFNKIKESKHVKPILNAVSSLSKEDLSELAESLINLTYLKRRVSMEEESVGGPIDVAIITKGDGFIWIKRKHYFNPALNQTFVGKQLNLVKK